MHLTALLKYTHRIDWRWSHIRETQNDPNFSNKTLYAVKRYLYQTYINMIHIVNCLLMFKFKKHSSYISHIYFRCDTAGSRISGKAKNYLEAYKEIIC